MAVPQVSRSKYEAVVHQKNRALARAREIRSGSGGYRAAGAVVAGNVAAAVVDAKMGIGTATYAGVAAAVAGVALGQPDAVMLASGLLGPAVYRASFAQASAFFSPIPAASAVSGG